MRNFFLLFFFCLTFLFLLSGCAAPEEQLSGYDPEAREITIAAVLPLSGKYKADGERMLSGLRYGEYELNSRRGINRKPMKLLVFDSRSTAAGAAEAFTAAAENNASGVVTGYSTEEAEQIAPLADTYRLPAVITMATADSTVGSSPFVFRNTYSDRQQGEALGAYLWYWRQLLRISVLMDSDPDHQYERSTARATAAAFKELGGTVTNMPAYRGKNYLKALNEAMITGPQAIVVSARGAQAAEIVKTLRAKGYKGIICGLDSWDTPEFFRAMSSLKNPGDCLYVSFFTPANRQEEFKDFQKGFRQKFFHEPGSCETMSYDALKLLAIALGNAATRRDLQQNLESIRNHFGAAATYTMLPDGNVDRTMYINAVEPPAVDGTSSRGRLIRSFMHSKLATYRYD